MPPASDNNNNSSVVSTEDAILTRLFENYQIYQPNNLIAMPLTDFVPPLSFEDIHAISRLMVEAVPSWENISAIVGVADRSAGSIVHTMSQLTGVPYTLCNWYPKGSTGSIVVNPKGKGFGDVEGPIILNGVGRGDRVIFADTCIRGGSTALEVIEALLKAGVTVCHAVFGCDFSDERGLSKVVHTTAGLGQLVNCSSVGTVMVDGSWVSTPDPASRPDFKTTQFKRNLLKGRIIGRTNPPASIPPPRPLEWQPSSMIQACFNRALAMFSGIPIYFAENSTYPYSNFSLTDFVPIMDSARVEDIADCMCYLSPVLRRLSRIHSGKLSTEGNFVNRVATSTTSAHSSSLSSSPTNANASSSPNHQQPTSSYDPNSEYILVSESDRGGGPLAVALSRRTGLQFSMANWNASVGDSTAPTSDHVLQVGYSGTGRLYLNGIRKGTKCIVVDDMLSSGGTCEGLLKSIEACGAETVECIFASEKTTTKGRERLRKTWKDLPLISVCYFSSESKTATIAAPPTPMGNETPVQKFETSPNAGERRERE